MNAQTVIVGRDRSGSVWTLLQLRSPIKKMMPWHLSAIGGRKDPEDKTPYDTARRELLEESGIVPDKLRKLGRGRKCMWFWGMIERKVAATCLKEVSDARFMSRTVPVDLVAPPYGHLWVRAENVSRIERLWPMMPGLVGRVMEASAQISRLSSFPHAVGYDASVALHDAEVVEGDVAPSHGSTTRDAPRRPGV